jgi:hypothetical protein
MSALIPEDLAELFEGGVSILVGTRDASMRPEATRGAGAVVHPDRRRITVFLPAEVSGRAVANLRNNGHIAVAFMSVIDVRALQVKGTVEELRDATEAEHAIITRYHSAFSEILYFTGAPRAVTRRLNVWPSTAVTFAVTDLYQQTPGPKAGDPLGARP